MNSLSWSRQQAPKQQHSIDLIVSPLYATRAAQSVHRASACAVGSELCSFLIIKCAVFLRGSEGSLFMEKRTRILTKHAYINISVSQILQASAAPAGAAGGGGPLTHTGARRVRVSSAQ